MGKLEPADRTGFEAHLADCAECRVEADALAPVVHALDDLAPPFDPPPDLRSRVMGAVEAAAAAEDAVRREPTAAKEAPRKRRAFPRLARPMAVGFAGALAVAVAVFVGVRIGQDDSSGGATSPLLAGKVEIAGSVTSPTAANEGRVVVRMQASGRAVRFRSSSLPILPKGDYYELWFVGPGDSPTDPNRISAGTFHPDEKGVTDVVLHAAVDPALFPKVEITAESGDGDPGADGPVVASLSAEDALAGP